MTGPLYKLGRACSRHPKSIVLAWALAALSLAFLGTLAGDRTSDNLRLPGTGSTTASDVLHAHLPAQANGSNPLVLQVSRGKLTDSANAQAVNATVERLEQTPHVTHVVSPLSADGAALLSKSGTIGYVPVTMDVGQGDITKSEARAVLDAGEPAASAGIHVSLGGYAGQKLSKPSTHESELIGLAAAVAILLLALGTVTAMALPIATALIGLIVTLSAIRLLGLLTDVPTVAPTLATMIGLGVGIDYALFIVTRHKLQLRDGMDVDESIARPAAISGGAVVVAGATVVIALCSLLVAGIPLVTNLGYTAAIAVVVGMSAAVTLLPALLGALGPRIDSLRVGIGRHHDDHRRPHGWERWARAVAVRPWRALVASVVVLVVLAIPLLHLHLGQSDVGALPGSTTARQAYDGMSTGFGAGSNGPLLVAVKLGKKVEDPATDPRLAQLSGALAQTADVEKVSAPSLDPSGHYAVYTVVPGSAPSSDATVSLVNELRARRIPQATRGTDATASVGGQTAGYIDLAARIGHKLPAIIAIVVALSFLVLMLDFRSLVVPAKAALMNLLSVGAAYGVVTAVFQDGRAAHLIGLDHAIPIVSFVPLLMFAILFGLSMDYEVFLLSQIREHYRQSGRPTKAVIDGLAGTGRVITSAALIMVCVFTSFVLNGDPVVKEFGVGLAVAIAIDATVVRCLLVPALMTLLGRASWWAPSWLAGGRGAHQGTVSGSPKRPNSSAPRKRVSAEI